MNQPPEIIRDFLPIAEFETFALAAMTYPHYTPCAFTANEEEDDGSIWTFGENLKEVNVRPEESMFQAVMFNRRLKYATDFYAMQSYFIQKFTKLLNVRRWWVMRINCTMQATENYVGRFHNDYGKEDSPWLHENCKTAVYYLNTNNGGTKFHDKDGPFVQSKANTLVKFPTSYQHAGVWCTNAKLRYALNMNYEENE
tara:strand:- start:64 stop:657 length:594 start_codon:yes stop_codon:yes gene_type:complete